MPFKPSRIFRLGAFLQAFDFQLPRKKRKKSATLEAVDKLLLLEKFIIYVVRFLIRKYIRK